MKYVKIKIAAFYSELRYTMATIKGLKKKTPTKQQHPSYRCCSSGVLQALEQSHRIQLWTSQIWIVGSKNNSKSTED